LRKREEGGARKEENLDFKKEEKGCGKLRRRKIRGIRGN